MSIHSHSQQHSCVCASHSSLCCAKRDIVGKTASVMLSEESTGTGFTNAVDPDAPFSGLDSILELREILTCEHTPVLTNATLETALSPT